MDVRHTFSNQFAQQKRKKPSRKKRSPPSIPSIPPATADFVAQPAVANACCSQDDNIVDLILELTQELVDMIQEYFFETIFCPGHYLPQIHNQPYHTWNKKTCQISRPDMLRLNRDIYRKYVQRMWTENTCVVKKESGLYFEMVPVQGHLCDPYGYLIERSKKHFPWLEKRLVARQFIDHGHAGSRSGDIGLSPQTFEGSLDRWSATRLKLLLERLYVTSVVEIPLIFTDQYSSAGDWFGIKLPEDINRLPDEGGIHPQEHSRILWKTFTFMARRRKECHRELMPLMAKKHNVVKLDLIMVLNQIFVFS
ncbi:MAG: hypothetical protein L6R38_009336 [Xanthoria sp. 2 TBL-2021]|nr:MAG: hypothetical protein L6R38_009336 [Xanthoria sp. 2 TBL-2021]